MNEKYLISDNRTIESFKQKTFSGFKKNDVITTVLKSIEVKKLESGCYWTTECILSGYSITLWDKLLQFSSKVININNPNLPTYLLKKNTIFMNQIKRLNTKDKNNVLLLRNSQMIRNLFFDVITTLSLSSKTKRYDKYPKLDEKEDFNFGNIQKRLFSQMKILPDHIIHFNDPDELRIIMNEIFTMCKNQQFGYDRCCYWVLWLVKWEQLHKKNKQLWNVSNRNVPDISEKYRSNFIWVVWETIYEEVKERNDKRIKQEIDSLYSLFKCNYTSGRRNSRLPFLFNAIGYLTHTVSFTIPIRSDYKTFIQVQSNVNKMFQAKKINEVKTEVIVHQKPPKKDNITGEQVKDKIDIFNEIDQVITG
jgi:hypothetical protein